MVKGISSINKFVKTGIASALLASSAALYASNSIKHDAEPNQMEVISKAGAEALKSTAMQGVTQTSVPTEHHAGLDRTLRKYIESEDDKQYIDNIINNVYKNNGTYLGSAIIQGEIDFQQFGAFIAKNMNLLIKNNIDPPLGNKINSFGPEFFKTLNSEKQILDLAQAYTQKINEQLKFNHKPSPIEVSDRIDEIVNNSDFLTVDDKIEYYEKYNVYIINKKKPDNIKSVADIIATKMFTLDRIVYTKILKKYNVFNENQFKDWQNKTMEKYFNNWICTVRPDKIVITKKSFIK